MGYRFARWFAHWFVRLTARLNVIGLEHVPFEDSFILASNHIGRLDAALIYTFTPRRDIILMVAEKYRDIPFVSWLANQLGVIWVDRFNADFSAVRATLKRLKQGGVLVLAPEGTRSHTGALQEGRPGVSFLAARAAVPIIPVALAGSDDALFFPNLRRLRKTPVTIRVGKPFALPSIAGDRETTQKIQTEEIMCRIAALLPPERRGVYAGHPRLAEILNETAVGECAASIHAAG